MELAKGRVQIVRTLEVLARGGKQKIVKKLKNNFII